jgi:hypothetical protein
VRVSCCRLRNFGGLGAERWIHNVLDAMSVNDGMGGGCMSPLLLTDALCCLAPTRLPLGGWIYDMISVF